MIKNILRVHLINTKFEKRVDKKDLKLKIQKKTGLKKTSINNIMYGDSYESMSIEFGFYDPVFKISPKQMQIIINSCVKTNLKFGEAIVSLSDKFDVHQKVIERIYSGLVPGYRDLIIKYYDVDLYEKNKIDIVNYLQNLDSRYKYIPKIGLVYSKYLSCFKKFQTFEEFLISKSLL